MFPVRIPSRIAALALALALPSLAFAGDPDDDDSNEKSGYLGVRLQRIEGGLAEALNLEEDGGVLIGQVVDESPAATAGLEEGDIVLKVDGQAVGTPDALREAVRGKTAGKQVSLEILRDGKPRAMSVKLGEAPARNDAQRRTVRWIERHRDGDRGGDDEDDGEDDEGGGEWIGDEGVRGERGYLGVMTQPITEELGDYFGVKGGKGALVSEVVKDSPASKLGLLAGDVITKVGGDEIEGPGDLMRAVRSIDAAEDVEIQWIRDKRVRTGKAAIELREGWAGSGRAGLEPLREMRGLRELRDLPKRMRTFERRMPPPGMSEMTPRVGGPGREDVEALRAEIETLRRELQKLKEEIRGE